MFTLYQRFIEQIKQEQIQKYNQKHRDYLLRSGKLKQDNKKTKTINNSDRFQKRQERKEQQNESQIRRKVTNPVNTLNMNQKKNQQEQKWEMDFKKDNREQRRVQQRNKQPEVINQPLQQRKQEKIQRAAIKQTVLNQRNKQPKLAPENVENTQNPFTSSNNFQIEEVQQVELVQCPQGCGRKFNSKALEKHVKICQKGQVKRKVFKVKVVDEEAEKLKKDDPLQNQNQKKNKIPKWKKDSNQIRNALKNMHSQGNQQSSEPQKQRQPQQEDDRKLCPGCGRKFNQKAAQKHIPGCVQRNNMKPGKK